MSSHSVISPERSGSVSSPAAADSTIDDTASSILAEGAPPEVTVQWLSNTPNSAFAQRMQDVRPRSVSPRPRRTASPSQLSVAQQRARSADQRAETALSGVEAVVDRTQRAQTVAEDAIAEARSVRAEASSRMA